MRYAHGTNRDGPDLAGSSPKLLMPSWIALPPVLGPFRVCTAKSRRAVLLRFPYAVYFRLDRETLVVLAVHGRQDPARWQIPFVASATGRSLYLFCTWTSGFERFSRFWRFGFPKALGNLDFWSDRLPAPPPLPLYEECFRCASIVPR